MDSNDNLEYDDKNDFKFHEFRFLVKIIGSHSIEFVDAQQVQNEKTYVDHDSDRNLNDKVDFHII
jgi:hypothetical protein